MMMMMITLASCVGCCCCFYYRTYTYKRWRERSTTVRHQVRARTESKHTVTFAPSYIRSLLRSRSLSLSLSL